MIQKERGLRPFAKLFRTSVPQPVLGSFVTAAVGNFDGIHCGHQQLLVRLKEKKLEYARRHPGLQVCSVLVSFYPHPDAVLNKSEPPAALMTLRQKLEILAEKGVDVLLLKRFTASLGRMTAADFVEQCLIRSLNVNCLIIGPDARVGYRREGDAEFIRACMQQHGRETEIVPFAAEGGEKISSGRLRSCVKRGDLAAVKRGLGRNYALGGRVAAGDGRGRKLGFPTANLHVRGQAVPGLGIYAGYALINGEKHPAAINIGIRPTFGQNSVLVEAHLIGFAGENLYGKRMELEFVERLRDENKFNSAAELCMQINTDIQRAKEILA